MASLDRKLHGCAAHAARAQTTRSAARKSAALLLLLLLPWVALATSCSVYDESLLEGDGSGGDGGSGAGASSGGEGGALPCGRASECPGEDTECRLRTCENGTCGAILAPQDTSL